MKSRNWWRREVEAEAAIQEPPRQELAPPLPTYQYPLLSIAVQLPDCKNLKVTRSCFLPSMEITPLKRASGDPGGFFNAMDTFWTLLVMRAHGAPSDVNVLLVGKNPASKTYTVLVKLLVPRSKIKFLGPFARCNFGLDRNEMVT